MPPCPGIIPTKTRPIAIEYLGVVCVAGLLYGLSCAPSLLWQDSGLIQYRVLNNDIKGFLGLALAHPLYYIAALGTKALPFGSLFWKVNLLSSFAGALALGNLYLLVRLSAGMTWPAVISVLTLGLAHTFWQHASMAETYTLWAALFTTELLFLWLYTTRGNTRFLYVLGLANGLAMSVHMLASLSALCYAVLVASHTVRRRIKPVQVIFYILAWATGALPYAWLVAREAVVSGNPAGALASAAFGSHWQGAVLNTSISARMVRDAALCAVLNIPSPLLLFVPVGLWFCVKSGGPFGKALAAMSVLYTAFAVRYDVHDRYAFFIPVYCLWILGIGYGLAPLLKAKGQVLCLAIACGAISPVLYAALPSLLEKAHISIGTRNDVPFRHDSTYFLQPWKTGYRGADLFALEALTSVEPNAIIHADLTTIAPLLITQQVHHLRPDVAIQNPFVSGPGAVDLTGHTLKLVLSARPVYVTSNRTGYCPEFIMTQGSLQRQGYLWRVFSKP